MRATVFPELVHGRNDGFIQGAWTLEPGSAFRGGASCNLTERVLRVPHGEDALSRIVQAHELMHIRVSPYLRVHAPSDLEISARALECAEEYRVNLLLHRLGFDMSLLTDGSERPGGKRLAQSGEWSETVNFFLAVLGTGAEPEFLRGIKAGRSEWVAGLRVIKKRVLSIVEGFAVAAIGDTSRDDQGIPSGYANVTIPVARVITRAGSSRAPEGVEDLRGFRRSLEPGARRAPSGRFAPLVFDESMTYVARKRHGGHRRPRPTTCGPVMRYPSRLLTDPQQRAFGQNMPRSGGVIVIDQSGSMDVTVEEVQLLLATAPDALIVGYSHRPGDGGGTPNAWVLAKAGRVASEARAGNVGNGVDGPILRWAIRQSPVNGSVVWVTDGQVTDSHDHPCHSLSVECARLVQRHRIRLVRGLDEVHKALQGRAISRDGFGRVSRELRNRRT